MKVLVTSFGADYQAKIFYNYCSKIDDYTWAYHPVQTIAGDFNILREADILWVWGFYGDAFNLFHVAKAVNPEIKTILTWVGSDIINFAVRIRETPVCRDCMLRNVDIHSTTSDNFMQELITLGLQPYYIPTIPEKRQTPKPLPETLTYATYIPPNAKTYYGLGLILDIASKYPDILINIFSFKDWNEEEKKAIEKDYPNIKILGSLNQKQRSKLIKDCRGYFSFMKHGGIDELTIEFLQAGRYVIINRDAPYCYVCLLYTSPSPRDRG